MENKNDQSYKLNLALSNKLRTAIMEGYGDAIAGRIIPYSGNLKSDMYQFQKLGLRSRED